MTYEPTDSYLASDAPIDGDERPDLLEREWFAEQVARRIAQAGTGESVVFGLAGPWGAGKISTLSLIKKALDNGDVSPDPWRVVEFTPWAVDDAYALAEEFYNTIASALDDKTGGKEAAAKKMLNAAAPALAAGEKRFYSVSPIEFSERELPKRLRPANSPRLCDQHVRHRQSQETFDPKKGNHTETLRGLTVLRALFPDALPRVDAAYLAVPGEVQFQVRKSIYFDRYFAFGFPAKDIRDGKVHLVEVMTIRGNEVSPVTGWRRTARTWRTTDGLSRN